MQCRMQPHEGITSLPINLEIDRLTDFRKARRRRGYVDHAVHHVALASIHYGDALSAGTNESPRVAWLSAPQGVEERSVQFKTPFMHGNHARGGGLEIRIVAKQQFSHSKA